MTDLALHHMSAFDVGPLTLVDIAADVGCGAVCLFVYTPDTFNTGLTYPTVTKAMVPELLRRLSDKNIKVGNAEFFSVTEAPVFDGFREGLELGAKLGSRQAVAHIHDPVAARAAENLAKLASLAAAHDMTVAIEFTPMSAGCKTVEQAAALIAAAGCENTRIGVDALHLVRSGGTPADVAAIDPKLMGYAQLCDGLLGRSHDYLAECFDRQVPGEGKFPLAALIAALPASIAYDVEVPLARFQLQGVASLARVKLAVSGARAVLGAM